MKKPVAKPKPLVVVAKAKPVLNVPKLQGKTNLEIDQNADMVIGNAASLKGVDETT